MELGILSKNTQNFPFNAKEWREKICVFYIFIPCNLFDRFVLCDKLLQMLFFFLGRFFPVFLYLCVIYDVLRKQDTIIFFV